MPRPLVIAIVGIDGAGKTTQAKLLADWLSQEGVAAAYFENPGGRPVTDWLARRLGRADTGALLGSRGRVAVETTVRAASLGRALAWSRATRRVAVLDRCAACQYALIRARGDQGEAVARAVLAPFGMPDLVLQLLIDEPGAQDRVARRGYDHEAIEDLKAFAAAYRSLPEAAQFHLIDAAGDITEVQARLRAAIRPLLPTLT